MQRVVRKIIYLLLVVVLALIVVYFPRSFSDVRNGVNENINAPMKKEPVSNPKLESDYEKDIHDILVRFSEGETAEKIQDEILGISVPEKYMTEHLDLVIIFNNIIKGKKDSDETLVANAMKKLDEMREKNKWMK